MKLRRISLATLALAVMASGWSLHAHAARIADIANTKHNFSATPPFANNVLPSGQTRDVRASTEAQICVFCHTPHGADAVQTPLWNRSLSTATYTMYGAPIPAGAGSANTSSYDAGIVAGGPTGISKLCLSCHDGTMAIGAVNVLNGRFTDQVGTTPDVTMVGTGTGGTMPLGAGVATGFTRYLGTNLTNDHPISMTFNTVLANADGEMRFPGAANPQLRVRRGAVRPLVDDIHLEPTTGTTDGGLVQCNSCHDPHIRDTTNEPIKFLRLNRLQKNAPPVAGAQFNKVNDIICLACHDKAGWANSAHAQRLVAEEVYTPAAALLREIPNGTQVWETACLACHDTHTVQGARRLLREGTDSTTTPKAGGNPAIEETCFACHSGDRATLVGQQRAPSSATFQVPDIKQDFDLPRHMPIRNSEQNRGFEIHDIGSANPGATTQRGKDFIEDPVLMGAGRNDGTNRHVECTDCHNPHRVAKRRLYSQDNANGTFDPAGTHNHAAMHTNDASGVLRGTWGVQPTWSNGAFGTEPTNFTVLRGDPSRGGSVVTKEYQVCLKCHSNYAYGTGFQGAPPLGYYPNGTPAGTNSMTRYTNQGMEFQPSDGPGANGQVNHRSWHPVTGPTNRPQTVRIADSNNWLAPFGGTGNVGNQTMYCSDCHGHNNNVTDGSVPVGGENGRPWGPHGSENPFLLKGIWSGEQTTGTGEGAPDHLCFRCHDYMQYANAGTPAASIQDSGFSLAGMGMCMMGGGGGGGGGGGMGGGGGGMGGMMCMAMGAGMGAGMGAAMNNIHIFHTNAVNNFRCNLCHVAVPHGWKNKNFLVNLNDVGPEAGLAAGTQVRNGGAVGPPYAAGYRVGPYYNRAALKIASFATSGGWSPDNCGSAGGPGNGITGVQWMANSGEACVDLP